MRWKAAKEPQEGQTREKRKFAWTPIRIGEYVVWLERYGITEKYESRSDFDSDAKIMYTVIEWVEIDRYLLDYYC